MSYSQSCRRSRVWDPDEDEHVPQIEKIRRPSTPKPVPKYGGANRRPDPTRDGVVKEIGPGRCRTWVDGTDWDCLLPARLLATQKESLAVGDRVRVRPLGGGQGAIDEVLPRRTVLDRPDPGNRHRRNVIAVNLDLAIIVATLTDPPFRPGLIDRYLVRLQKAGIDPILCLNKLDVWRELPECDQYDSEVRAYVEIGIPVFRVSAATGEGIDSLRESILGRTLALIGHSGVGKSSLVNALAPESDRREGHVRSFDGKGRHTTTGSCLIDLGQKTLLIDTPGVRSFGLGSLHWEEVLEAFPEIRHLGRPCRFSDCRHLDEPECAVREAVEQAEIPGGRYSRYRRLVENL
ncbi:MAG TPA: ribosome small subunit-dependent GTPase A [Candidatus Ozemobacteraceae bacterium]|nr:ribosome small subunit-dependent GTPase A [Candidatus Ozemobacteraceae bacterium]